MPGGLLSLPFTHWWYNGRYSDKILSSSSSLSLNVYLTSPVQSIWVVDVVETSLYNLRETSPHVHTAFLLSLHQLILNILSLLLNFSLFPANRFVIFNFHRLLYGCACGNF